MQRLNVKLTNSYKLLEIIRWLEVRAIKPELFRRTHNWITEELLETHTVFWWIESRIVHRKRWSSEHEEEIDIIKESEKS